MNVSCFRADYRELVAGPGGHLVPVYAAIVFENVEQRIAGGQVLARHAGAVDFQRLAFAQHEQSGGVVDLRIHQHDRADRGVADRPCRLQFRERLELREQVGRSVEQHPVDVVGADGDGGLGAGRGPDGALAYAVAHSAIAVPLRKASASRGTQNLYSHCPSKLWCYGLHKKRKPREGAFVQAQPRISGWQCTS